MCVREDIELASDDDFDRWFRRWRRWRGPDFENIEKVFDDMFRELIESVPKGLYREERQPDGRVVKRIGPFVYGYSMTLGPDGKPVIREFGNVKPSMRPMPNGISKPSLEVRGKREPLVDIISDNETIRVIAEVPGVDKNDIKLNCSEKTLTISVDSENRKYYKEVELPSEVDPKIGKAKYTNGVLEVVLTKIKAKKPSDESIKIE
jgi:HSP20 family protein